MVIENLLIHILLAVIVIVIAIFRFSLFSSEAKGKRGERIIANYLKKLDPDIYSVMNDVMLPDGITCGGTTQIDHIVLSVYGIFVIETKHYSGWIFGDEKSSQWCQSIYGYRSYFQNPYRQNYKHVCCLSALTGIPRNSFIQIVAFTGDCSIKTIEELPTSFVTDRDELLTFILAHKTKILDKNAVAFIEKTIRSFLIKKTTVSLDSHVSYVSQRKYRN